VSGFVSDIFLATPLEGAHFHESAPYLRFNSDLLFPQPERRRPAGTKADERPQLLFLMWKLETFDSLSS
jgi:hypothetical protein